MDTKRRMLKIGAVLILVPTLFYIALVMSWSLMKLRRVCAEIANEILRTPTKPSEVVITVRAMAVLYHKEDVKETVDTIDEHYSMFKASDTKLLFSKLLFQPNQEDSIKIQATVGHVIQKIKEAVKEGSIFKDAVTQANAKLGAGNPISHGDQGSGEMINRQKKRSQELHQTVLTLKLPMVGILKLPKALLQKIILKLEKKEVSKQRIINVVAVDQKKENEGNHRNKPGKTKRTKRAKRRKSVKRWMKKKTWMKPKRKGTMIKKPKVGKTRNSNYQWRSLI